MINYCSQPVVFSEFDGLGVSTVIDPLELHPTTRFCRGGVYVVVVFRGTGDPPEVDQTRPALEGVLMDGTVMRMRYKLPAITCTHCILMMRYRKCFFQIRSRRCGLSMPSLGLTRLTASGKPESDKLPPLCIRAEGNTPLPKNRVL